MTDLRKATLLDLAYIARNGTTAAVLDVEAELRRRDEAVSELADAALDALRFIERACEDRVSVGGFDPKSHVTHKRIRSALAALEPPKSKASKDERDRYKSAEDDRP